MKILLTGHKGFIGGHAHTALSVAGHDVHCWDWLNTTPFPGPQGYDWVVHIGANSSTVERDVDKIMIMNYDFSVNLYESCARHGVNFQYSSSASVYGLKSTFKEDANPDPRNPYAWTKYLFERYVQRNPRDIITQGFRYFNVYGPEGEDHKGSQASPHNQFKRQFENTGQIKVFENSEQYRRDFVPVSQVVSTHIDFFNVPESGIWNVGTGKTQSFIDVAHLYTKNLVEIPMPEVLRSNYQEYTCANTEKLAETLRKYNKIPVDE